MDKATKMKPSDQAVLTLTQQEPAPEPNGKDSLAEVLRAAHERMEAETKADEKNKSELDDLIRDLIALNAQKREMYKLHTEARMERQAHNTAQGQVEADARAALLQDECDILWKMRQKLGGEHPGRILLPGQQNHTPRPPRKRSWWRRLVGMR